MEQSVFILSFFRKWINIQIIKTTISLVMLFSVFLNVLITGKKGRNSRLFKVLWCNAERLIYSQTFTFLIQ